MNGQGINSAFEILTDIYSPDMLKKDKLGIDTRVNEFVGPHWYICNEQVWSVKESDDPQSLSMCLLNNEKKQAIDKDKFKPDALVIEIYRRAPSCS